MGFCIYKKQSKILIIMLLVICMFTLQTAQGYAFVLVDDAILLICGALLIAGGIYFTTDDGAKAAAEDFYNFCSDTVKQQIETSSLLRKLFVTATITNTLNAFKESIANGEKSAIVYNSENDFITCNQSSVQPGYGYIGTFDMRNINLEYDGRINVTIVDAGIGCHIFHLHRNDYDDNTYNLSYTNIDIDTPADNVTSFNLVMSSDKAVITFSNGEIFEITGETLYLSSVTAFSGSAFDYRLGNYTTISVPVADNITINETIDVESLENKEVAVPIGATVVTDLVDTTADTIEQDEPLSSPLCFDLNLTYLNDMFLNKLGNGPLKNILAKFESFDTSPQNAPIVYVNIYKILECAKHVGSFDNPFADENSVFIDFGLLEDYEYGGYNLVEYFKALIGAGFIWRTFLYVWRKITPDKVVL